jgi:hypothetical protein
MTLVLAYGEFRRVVNEKPTNSNLIGLTKPTMNMTDIICGLVVFSI